MLSRTPALNGLQWGAPVASGRRHEPTQDRLGRMTELHHGMADDDLRGELFGFAHMALHPGIRAAINAALQTYTVCAQAC